MAEVAASHVKAVGSSGIKTRYLHGLLGSMLDILLYYCNIFNAAKTCDIWNIKQPPKRKERFWSRRCQDKQRRHTSKDHTEPLESLALYAFCFGLLILPLFYTDIIRRYVLARPLGMISCKFLKTEYGHCVISAILHNGLVKTQGTTKVNIKAHTEGLKYIWSKSRLYLMLLLLAGDVHLNPGPVTRSHGPLAAGLEPAITTEALGVTLLGNGTTPQITITSLAVAPEPLSALLSVDSTRIGAGMADGDTTTAETGGSPLMSTDPARRTGECMAGGDTPGKTGGSTMENIGRGVASSNPNAELIVSDEVEHVLATQNRTTEWTISDKSSLDMQPIFTKDKRGDLIQQERAPFIRPRGWKTTGQNKAAKGTNATDAAEYLTRHKATLNKQIVSNHSYSLQHIVSTVSGAKIVWDRDQKPKGIFGAHLNIRSLLPKLDEI